MTLDGRARPRSGSRGWALLAAWITTIALIPVTILTVHRGSGLGIYATATLGIILASLAIGAVRSSLRYMKAILTSTRNVAHRLKLVETVLDGTRRAMMSSESHGDTCTTPTSPQSTADQTRSSDGEVYGRQATPVPSGIDVGWEYLSTMVDQAPRSNVAVLAGAARIEYSTLTQTVGTLVPGIARALVEQIQPRTLVIDRLALQNGPWYGVETAQRTVCALELLKVAAYAKNAGAQVVYVDAPLPPDINTHIIKACADVVLPSPTIFAQADGAPLSVELKSLVELARLRFSEPRNEMRETI